MGFEWKREECAFPARSRICPAIRWSGEVPRKRHVPAFAVLETALLYGIPLDLTAALMRYAKYALHYCYSRHRVRQSTANNPTYLFKIKKGHALQRKRAARRFFS